VALPLRLRLRGVRRRGALTRRKAATRRFPLGLTLATAIGLAVAIGLGVWQLQRLAWKRNLIARVEALQSAPAQSVGPVLERLAAGEDVGFTRVRISCPGLGRAPYLELYGLREGQAGSRLVSACPVSGSRYGSILVDRGFVGDTISSRPPIDPRNTDVVEVVGVLRPPEPRTAVTPANRPEANRWFARDVPGMAAALKALDPAPIFLMAETSSNPEWLALKPSPLPAQISNRHLEYALTWFGLAAALAGVYAAFLLRRRTD
jgi:surfeit locus 1 family protein